MRELTLEEVQTLLTEGVNYARSRGFPNSVAVVDFGGVLRGMLRPEKGRIANPDIAFKKAWTAVALHRPSSMVRELMITPDRLGHGLQTTDSRFCIVGGGFPLFDEAGDIIGAVGSSGGPLDVDIESCLVGMRKLGFRTEFADPIAAKPAAASKSDAKGKGKGKGKADAKPKAAAAKPGRKK